MDPLKPHVYTILVLFFFPSLFCTAKENTVNINGHSPFVFIENKGQVTDQDGQLRLDIDMKLDAGAVTIFLGDGQLHYQWVKTNSPGRQESEPVTTIFEATENQTTSIYRMDVTLLGANKNATLITEDKTDYYENYYLPCLPDGITVNTYRKIIYKDIYPNIDWVLYTNSKDVLKYDFIIHPGGNAKDIKIQYDGTTELALNNGVLIASTPYGSITESAPYTYILETKEEVIAQYQLKGNILRFDVATAEGTIVIDPQLEWATYYGGSHNEEDMNVACDANNQIYLSGDTKSVNNIATTGAFQTSKNNWRNSGYLVKFNSSGQRQWATYYGGHTNNNNAYFHSIACDLNNDVYIGGQTYVGLATNNSHQSTISSGSAAGILVKFNSSGQRIWATYYGHYVTTIYDIAVSPYNELYICGNTYADSGIATSGSHKAIYNNFKNPAIHPSNRGHAFLAKFTTSGIRKWGTYFGDSIFSLAYSVSSDDNGNAIICGRTNDTVGIATINTHQEYIGSVTDGFIAKFDSSGNLSWGTYFGGNKGENIYGSVCDDTGNIYICGSSNSDSGIATQGAYQVTKGGGSFISKFTSGGKQVWGTYFGKCTDTQDHTGIYSIDIDNFGDLIMTGTTECHDLATLGGNQWSIRGEYDAILLKFTPTGNYVWSTFLGGFGKESGSDLAIDTSNYIYITGSTGSTSGLATVGAHQTTYGGLLFDAFLAKLNHKIDTVIHIDSMYKRTLCSGDSLKMIYKVTPDGYASNNTFTAQLSNSSGSFANPVNIGSINSDTSDTLHTVIPASTTTGANYKVRIISSSPTDTSIDSGIVIYASPAKPVASYNGPLCSGDTLLLFAVSNTSGVDYLWTGPNNFSDTAKNPVRVNAQNSDSGLYILTTILPLFGCSAKDTISTTVHIIPDTPIASSNSPACPGTTLKLFASSGTNGVTYSWTGPNNFSSSIQNPWFGNTTTALAGTYYVTASKNGCTSIMDSTDVVVAITTPTPTASSVDTICAGEQLELYASAIPNTTYTWEGPNNFADTNQNPIIFNASTNAKGTYIVKAVKDSCVSLPDSTTSYVRQAPTVNIYPNPSDTICSGNNATLVSITSNSTTPYYQWFVNSQLVGTGNIYTTTTLQDGDMIHCELTDSLRCKDPFTDTSNTIKMNVLPWLAPTVSITANPSRPIHPHEYVTFTANTANAGNNPAYQWLRNSIDIIGAQSSIWSANTLNDNDTVSVIITSSYKCPQPKTDTSNTVIIKLSSVNDNQLISTFTLYPNPNNGQFILRGNIEQNTQLQLVIYNSLGQVVHSDIATVNNGSLFKKLDLSLPSGIYIIKLSDGRLNATTSFTIH